MFAGHDCSPVDKMSEVVLAVTRSLCLATYLYR